MGQRRRQRWKLLLKPRLLLAVILLALLMLLTHFMVGRPPAIEKGNQKAEEPRQHPAAVSDSGPVTNLQTFSLRAMSTPPPPGSAGDPGGGTFSTHGIAQAGRAVLTGRVLDQSGQPVTGARVRLIRGLNGSAVPGLAMETEIAGDRTDASGAFLFDVTPPPGGLVRILMEDSRGAKHTTACIQLEPWEVTVLPDTRFAETGPVVLSTGDKRELHVVLRPCPAPLSWGPAPLLVNSSLLPILSREHVLHTLVAGSPLTLPEIGAGDWEILVFGADRRPRRIRVTADESLDITLEDASTSPAAVVQAFSSPILLLEQGPLPVATFGTSNIPVASWLATGSATALAWRPGTRPESLSPTKNTTSLELAPRGRATWDPRNAGHWEPSLAAADPLESDGGGQPGSVGHLPCTAGPRGELQGFLLPAGSYKVTWVCPEFGVREPGGTIQVVPYETISLSPPENSALPRTLEGRILDQSSGEPLGGAEILVGRNAGALLSTTLPAHGITDLSGRFSISGLPDGKIQILVVSQGNHPIVENIELPEAQGSRAVVRIECPRGSTVRTRITESSGRGIEALPLAVVNRRGQILRGTTDQQGVCVFAPLAPETYALLAVFGQLSVPLDSWDWLSTRSGARIFQVSAATVEQEVAWVLPRPGPWDCDVQLNGASAATLQIVHAGAFPSPGIWPDFRLGSVRTGKIRIDRMLPGRYRALATFDDHVDMVDFEIIPMSETTLNFHFGEKQ